MDEIVERFFNVLKNYNILHIHYTLKIKKMDF